MNTRALQPGQAVRVEGGHAALFVGGRFLRMLGDGDTAFAAWRRTSIEALDEDTTFHPHKATQAAALREIGELRGARERLSQGLTEFLGEKASPPPGPYDLGGARLVMCIVRDPALRVMVPPRLHSVVFDDRYLLVFSDFPEARGRTDSGADVSLAYRETAIFMPVLGPGLGGPGLFCPALWPDNMMAGLVGRELFALPKRYGWTSFAPGGVAFALRGELSAVLRWSSEEPQSMGPFLEDFVDEVLGRDVASGLIGKAAAAIGLRGFLTSKGSTAPLYVARKYANFQRNRDWTTDEIHAVETGMSEVTDIRRLRGAKLDLRLPLLRDGEIKAAWDCRVNMRFEGSCAVRDHRRPWRNPMLFSRALLGRVRGLL